jgi:hypothetical protein
MIFALLLLLSALLISAMAGYFSIVGLTLIFSAAPLQIAAMGAVLELGKLVTASFLYKSWHKINRIMKVYFTISVVVLSVITSLGIFGYLSKAYISDSTNMYSNEIQLNTKQELLKIEKNRLSNLLLQQSQKTSKLIDKQINDTQAKISTITEEIGTLKNSGNSLGKDIGPARYIAELVYGSGDLDIIDKTVRLIILILMLVFDPLAILLVIAANIQFAGLKQYKEYEKENSIEIDKRAIFNMEK